MTTTTAPEFTATLRDYVDTVYAYNNALSDLNTSFGGMNLQPSLFDSSAKISETLENANEFIEKREAQIALIRKLGKKLSSYVEDGVDAQYRRYQTDAQIIRIQEANATKGEK
jgi:hypothetical protein